MGCKIVSDPVMRALHAAKLAPWLKQLGIKASPAMAATKIYQKFGEGKVKFRQNGDLIRSDGALLLHRDDVRNFLFGKEVRIVVGPEPPVPPMEIEVPKVPKVVQYEELDDGTFKCLGPGCEKRKPYKREAAVVKHIRDKH